MSTLELRGVSKVFPGGHRAVREVDLVVADGDLVIIAGPSGCGKSTVLRMVAGLEEPTAGVVLIDGDTMDGVRTSERDVALASQSYALYPHLTVAENIGFPLRIDRIHQREIDRQVSHLAGLLQLSDVLDRTPGQLSGGQQQRTAMGRAIIRDPRLLLLDEPMSNLDAKLRTQTGYLITQIQRRLGLTTLMVTHDQHEAMALGDQLAVMRDGRIVQSGRPIDVYEHPIDIFVAQFVGTPSMSVILARIIESDDRLAVRVGSHDVVLTDNSRALRPRVGNDVALGLRPDALGRDTPGQLSLDVVSTTVVGHERFVELAIDAPRVTQRGTRVEVVDERGSTIVMSAHAAEAISLWEPCPIAIDTARLHFFDLDTGLRIP